MAPDPRTYPLTRSESRQIPRRSNQHTHRFVRTKETWHTLHRWTSSTEPDISDGTVVVHVDVEPDMSSQRH